MVEFLCSVDPLLHFWGGSGGMRDRSIVKGVSTPVSDERVVRKDLFMC